MAPLRSLIVLAFTSLILDTAARFAPAYKIHQAHKHEARDLGGRMVGPPYMPIRREAIPTTSDTGVLTYVTPSPGANPIAVTEQSQYVTSFVPQYTLCELPPVAFYSASPYRPSMVASTAPYQNYSISVPEGNGTCTTIYKPTHTMVCATTLTGLFDKWTVSQCHQDLTFSTQYGFALVTPTPTPAAAASSTSAPLSTSAPPPVDNSAPVLNDTVPAVLNGTNATLQSVASIAPRQASQDPTITPGPRIETLTTYYLAPWQELTAGTVPSDIDLKVCRTFENGTQKCVREYQSWHTSLITKETTTVTSVNISTTIHGLSQIIVETFVANVTEAITTFSMNTTIDVGFKTELETTHVKTRKATITSTSPTIYLMKTLEEASATDMPSSATTGDDDGVTSTVTLRRTSTIIVETRTTTIPTLSASAPVITASPYEDDTDDSGDTEEVTVDVNAPQTTNYASMLGVGQPERARV